MPTAQETYNTTKADLIQLSHEYEAVKDDATLQERIRLLSKLNEVEKALKNADYELRKADIQQLHDEYKTLSLGDLSDGQRIQLLTKLVDCLTALDEMRRA